MKWNANACMNGVHVVCENTGVSSCLVRQRVGFRFGVSCGWVWLCAFLATSVFWLHLHDQRTHEEQQPLEKENYPLKELRFSALFLTLWIHCGLDECACVVRTTNAARSATHGQKLHSNSRFNISTNCQMQHTAKL